MTKLLLSRLAILFFNSSYFLLLPQLLQAQYHIVFKSSEGDAAVVEEIRGRAGVFKTKAACEDYVNGLPEFFRAKGYIGASVDSLRWQGDTALVEIYLGQKVRLARLQFDSMAQDLLQKAGIRYREYQDKPLDLGQIGALQENLLRQSEEIGYPFARVRLDSILLVEGDFTAKLSLDIGPLYKIDSISNLGGAKLAPAFLQRYLNIKNGSPYRRSALELVSGQLAQLSYVREQQPWTLTRLATGAIINLYLEPRKSNQLNVLLGLLPATSIATNNYEAARTKLQLTGEAMVHLKNALGKGESIGLNWQQLQVNSPRLNLLYDQSYIFGSPFGFKFQFDLFKKDTSFVTINMFLGSGFNMGSGKTGTFFVQSQRSTLVAVDTGTVSKYRQLPNAADLSTTSVGLQFDGYTTNYRQNPVRGNEWQLNLAAGTRKIRENDGILKIKDGNDPGFNFKSLYDSLKLSSYQIRIKAYAAHFFPLASASTLRLALHAGLVHSSQLFRNELFQIGGYKLLRGFDEESIYASHYLVAGLEYRYLIGRNSRFYGFVDGGWVRNTAVAASKTGKYWSGGLGMTLETKGGLFNLAVAAGKRNDLDFSLRQAKLHFGYVNFF